MKTIEERAWEKYPEVIKHHNLAHIDINEEKRRMYIEIATEQKAIDDAELSKLKSALENEKQINRRYYNQGYYDAFKKACKWFTDYLMEIGYPDDWMRDSTNILSGEERFIKAMEK